MNLSERRAARNEALFREVNERIDLHSDPQGVTAEFVCECAADTCTERLTVPLATYERVRNSPLLLLMAPGHERPELELEHVIERGAGFRIVKKDLPAPHGAATRPA